MTMTNNVPDWMTPVAWIFIAAAVISAVAIAFDIYGRGHRRENVATELVWVTSALYLGPLAVGLYAQHRNTERVSAGHDTEAADAPSTSAVVTGLPGGGASAVAHLIGVPLVLASGLTIAGIDLWVMILVIGVLAMLILFVFERTASSSLDHRITAGTAAGAAVLTVLAFDIGMGGWMLLLHFNEYMPPADEGPFWFLMQVGIILGLLTGYPVATWLARRARTLTPA